MTDEAVCEAVREGVREAVRMAVWEAVREPVWVASVRVDVGLAVWRDVSTPVWAAARQDAQEAPLTDEPVRRHVREAVWWAAGMPVAEPIWNALRDAVRTTLDAHVRVVRDAVEAAVLEGARQDATEATHDR
jgi:hypothetical protein